MDCYSTCRRFFIFKCEQLCGLLPTHYCQGIFTKNGSSFTYHNGNDSLYFVKCNQMCCRLLLHITTIGKD